MRGLIVFGALTALFISDPSSALNSIATGTTVACALTVPGIQCWGGPGPTWVDLTRNLPKVDQPTAITVGREQACVIDGKVVLCWGHEALYKFRPLVNNPREVCVGIEHGCALDDDGVKCWGNGYYNYNIMDVPPLKHPRELACGYAHTCVVQDGGVQCWGDNNVGQLNVPPMKNPKMLKAFGARTCAVDGKKVVCWGGLEPGSEPAPAFKNPRALSVGLHLSCMLDDQGVKCWGFHHFSEFEMPHFNNPFEVSAGEDFACARDRDGVQCWGDDNYGQMDIPALQFTEQFSLSELNAYLARLITWSPMAPQKFLQVLAEFAASSLRGPGQDIAIAQYLAWRLLAPLILSNDSEIHRERLIPFYQWGMPHAEQTLRVKGLEGVSPSSPLNRKVALQFLRAALVTALEFTAAAEQAPLQDALRSVGEALAHPQEAEPLQEVIRTLLQTEAQVERLNRNPRTTYLAQTLKLVATWLTPRNLKSSIK